jgi:hypothetical protein
MPSPPERSRYRVAAYAFLTILALLAIIPLYLRLDPDWRPFALRMAGALIVIVVCGRVVGSVRRALEEDHASALDTPPLPPRRPAVDERFVRVRDDVVFSAQSRRYFDAFLWPRLRALGGAELEAPPVRSRSRRGPSLSALERLIAKIERVR